MKYKILKYIKHLINIFIYNKKQLKNMKYNIGDDILINVQSDNCDCVRNTTVTEVINNYVYTKMSSTTINGCIACAKANGMNAIAENTCKWSITKFNIEDIELNTTELV